jgi:hypothetical protein
VGCIFNSAGLIITREIACIVCRCFLIHLKVDLYRAQQIGPLLMQFLIFFSTIEELVTILLKIFYKISTTFFIHICHSRCFGIRGGHGKSAFKLAVKLSVELGYVFLSMRL